MVNWSGVRQIEFDRQGPRRPAAAAGQQGPDGRLHSGHHHPPPLAHPLSPAFCTEIFDRVSVKYFLGFDRQGIEPTAGQQGSDNCLVTKIFR